jgi:ATP-dependent Clp protease ATP-binding subunit ClpA
VLDIEPGQIRAELARRRENAPADSGGGASATAGNSGAATPDGLGFGTQAAKALELAVNESTALGNNYIGCEHVLLGLIAEPDGAAGSVLRSLGADLRLTRRAVAAALAGYYHLQSRAAVSGSASGAAAGSGVGPGWASQLEAAIQAQLRPVIERLDQLERRVGSPA